jgi:predicted ATPase
VRKIVITGGAYSGKSTLVERLSHEGFSVAPEAAMQVIEALNAELGLEAATAWRRADPAAFQARIAELQLAAEAAAERSGSALVVCDRGLHDGLAYCRHWGIEAPAALLEALRGRRYDAVFVLETLTGFETRGETGRIDDHTESLQIRDLVDRVYREYDHAPLALPEMPLAERLAEVRRAIDALI